MNYFRNECPIFERVVAATCAIGLCVVGWIWFKNVQKAADKRETAGIASTTIRQPIYVRRRFSCESNEVVNLIFSGGDFRQGESIHYWDLDATNHPPVAGVSLQLPNIYGYATLIEINLRGSTNGGGIIEAKADGLERAVQLEKANK